MQVLRLWDIVFEGVFMGALGATNYQMINKSQLMDELLLLNDNLNADTVDKAVKEIIELIICAICNNRRVEVRGFGSFCLHQHKDRQARNPKTGEALLSCKKQVVHFKAGKVLRELVDYQ